MRKYLTAPGFESTTFESRGFRANHGATTMAKMSNKTFSFSKPCFTQQSFKLFSPMLKSSELLIGQSNLSVSSNFKDKFLLAKVWSGGS